jgi:hypothetical protein
MKLFALSLALFVTAPAWAAEPVGFALALFAALILAVPGMAYAACPYDPNCLNNPYGAGSPYKPTAS